MTHEQLAIFMKDFGFKPSMTKSEVKHLPDLLQQGENLLGLVDGWLKRISNRDVNGHGLLIVTDRRVIFYRRSVIGTETKEEYPLGRISSAAYRKGLLLGSITVYASNNEGFIENCDKKIAEKVANIINELISKPQLVAQTHQAPKSLSDQLRELAKLKEDGILTEDEFAQQKAKLLS